MRAVVGRIVAAVISVGVGGACWEIGQLEHRVVEAHQALGTLHYRAPAETYEAIEQSLGLAARLPWLADGVEPDVHEARAVARYWAGDYAALILPRDASGAVVETDPDVLFLAANAAYRTSQAAATDRQGLLRSLDAAVGHYAEVLKNTRGHQGAAYNFEF